MKMIDVMKRLAELDATNPNVIKESASVQECGPMGMMGGPTSHTPASINMTADSGSELTGMLRDIMQLAGVHQVGPQDLGVEHEPMSLTAEPVAAVGPAIAEPLGAADSMRSVLDKLNPEPADDKAKELGPFQHDGDDVQAGNDAGDEEPEDDEEETDEAKELGQAVQNTAPGEEIQIDGKEVDTSSLELDGVHRWDHPDYTDAYFRSGAFVDGSPLSDEQLERLNDEHGDLVNQMAHDSFYGESQMEEENYDNSPADPTNAPPADADEYAHHENQPGSGETSNGEKRQSNLPTATFENLMSEYRKFLGEDEQEDDVEESKEEDLEEGTCSACHKDPCACDKTEESTLESLDILKLAGLK